LVGSIFHVTRKIVSEMTYNVSMGTLNPTIPYYANKLDKMIINPNYCRFCPAKTQKVND